MFVLLMRRRTRATIGFCPIEFLRTEEVEMLKAFLNYMKQQGWNVELNESRKNHLPKEITERYPNPPQQWLDFISTVKSTINRDNTTQFLCKDDYDIQDKDAFQWNEYELISLDSAEGHTKWENEIKEFWNNRLPIIMSVKCGYSYYVISMKNGSIVQGNKPEFEKCEVVADSFLELPNKIKQNEIII